MGISVLAIILVIILSGIIYIIYSVKTAEIQDEHLDEPVDKTAFSKPAGWKVGKMPPELQNAPKMTLKKIPGQRSQTVVDDLVERWKKKDIPNLPKTDQK